MERRDIEIFIACLALAGIKEVQVPSRAFYLLAKHEGAASGYDKTGRYLDIGASRIRPTYKQPTRVFNDQADIDAFVAQMVKEV